jgi:hypothetical protein
MKLRMPSLALVALAIVAAPLLAQDAPSAKTGHNRQGGGPPVYDVAGETTLTGKVAEVLPQSCPRAGIHLRLTTATGDVEVGLGPTTYLAEIGAGFSTGDEIAVTGSKPKNDAPADFLARSVKKGEATYELRDAEGAPRWAMAGGPGCAMKGGQGKGHRHGAQAQGGQGKGCGCCQRGAAQS